MTFYVVICLVCHEVAQCSFTACSYRRKENTKDCRSKRWNNELKLVITLRCFMLK